MIKLKELISKELFINAYNICKNYCESELILDVNFRLLKNQILALSEKKVSNYYKTFIETDMVYALPEFFSSDIVYIPKNMTGTREYRFFATYSMFLYNAVGLFFVECCSEVINELRFKNKKVFAFYPTKFKVDDNNKHKTLKNKWKAENNYKDEYRDFLKKLESSIEPGNIILKLDITQYFESIPHKKLIKLLKKYAPETTLKKYNFQKDSDTVLEFYFESLMGKKHSIPQGRKNFVSDYFGYLYLISFDLEVESLSKNKYLTFKGLVRYVDDIYLVFENPQNIEDENIFKELLSIESTIINWFLRELNLIINPSKTERKIIDTENTKKKFIKSTVKAISSPEKNNVTTAKPSPINASFDGLISELNKFKFKEFPIKKEDKEKLKIIFDGKLRDYIFKPDNKKLVIDTINNIDIELTVDYINILIILFTLSKKNETSKPFINPLIQFLHNMNYADKRHLHILQIALAQNIDFSKIKKEIVKHKENLLLDDYGKYLVLFLTEQESKTKKEIDYLSCNSIYNRIANEFYYPKNRGFLFDLDNPYITIINNLLNQYADQDSIVRQIKYYVSSRRNQQWDLAFNYLLGIFHELCKIAHSLDDDAKVPNIIAALDSKITLTDELIIRKFFKRRNANLISHPSQNGIPSIKVDEQELRQYESQILPLINKVLFST